MNRALNVRRERFCEFIAAGESQTDAYIKAGFKVPKADARKHAARLMTKDDVSARIAELRKPQTKAALLKKEDNLRFLASIIQTPISQISPDSPLCAEYTEEVVVDRMRKTRKGCKLTGDNDDTGETVIRRRVKKQDPLRAIEIYSKLAGHFAPEKVEVDNSRSRIADIAERAKYVSSALARAYQREPSGESPESSPTPASSAEEAQQTAESEPAPDPDKARGLPARERWR